MAEFGEQLRKAREAQGMTQQTLAEKVYVTRQTVSRWESGERYPDILTLKKLSSILNVSADELLGEEKLPVIVEKSPIIEKPLANNIVVALNAAIVLIFLIQGYNDLGAFYNIDEIMGNHYFAFFMAGCSVLEAVLFVFSFTNVLRGTDTPKKTGFVISAFFILELFPRIESVFNRSGVGVTVLAFLCFIPYILGGVGGYLYFMSEKRLKAGKIFVYAASVFEVYAMFIIIRVVALNYPSFVTLSILLSSVLKLLICLTFIYETYLLGKRRTMANES